MTTTKKCKHIEDGSQVVMSVPFFKRSLKKECPNCKDTAGLIMCLDCGECWCMSSTCPEVKGRMSHYAETGHKVDMKVSLIKPYCWGCMSIIEHPKLEEIIKSAYEILTGAPPPPPQETVDVGAVLAQIGKFNDNWKNFQDRFDDVLKGCLGQAFGFTGCTLTDAEKLSVLNGDVSLDNIMYRVKQGEYKNIIVMSGAGISTSANIPDFRSPGTGLYDNLEKYDLPTPQAIFDINYFDERPEAFFQLAAELYPGLGKYFPTPTHHFIKMLADKGVLLRNYTQNIDGLERVAGVPAELLVEAHGTFSTCTCRKCNKRYPGDRYKIDIVKGQVPACFKCGGVVKPDIVFFGESLPERYKQLHKEDFDRCDLLIIMGTSLSVAPFNNLVCMVPQTTPRVLVNREEVGTNFDFSPETAYRDVFVGGHTDDAVKSMADKLEWREDLDYLIDPQKAEKMEKISKQSTASEKPSNERSISKTSTTSGKQAKQLPRARTPVK